MILFYLNNQNQNHARIIRNLFRSYQGKKEIQTTLKFAQSTALNQKANLIVFAGIIRGDGLIYKYCIENKKNYLYVDHAYLNRGYNTKSDDNEWMRITYNAFNWSTSRIETGDRWNTFFANKHILYPWNSNNGKNILVLPPSEATKLLFPQSVEWTEKAIEEIAKRTTALIKIREKPNQPVVDIHTNQVIDKKIYTHENTIEEELANAKLIVTFNSSVTVTGTILGIPCYCSPYAASYPMSIDLDQLDMLVEPKRQEWLNQLVYHQYNTTEMKNGKVWTLVNKYKR
jgi:hypothetical protein